MKAAQISQYGEIETITLNSDVPAPSPAADQIQIKVQAASLNPVDTILRKGYMHQMMPLNFPATLGGDIAGEVTAVGKGVTTYNVGDKVYGQSLTLSGGSGALAEYATSPVGTVSAMPNNLSYSEAAAAPLTGVSALQALTENANLQSGQTLLILGAAGGIGTIAIQIAKKLGATVIAAVRGTEVVEHVVRLGADQVLDMSAGHRFSELHDVDVVLDNIGGDDAKSAFTTLKKGGSFVSLARAASDELGEKFKVTAINQMTGVTSERLKKLTQLIESGAVTMSIEKTFPLSEVRAAFIARENGGTKGKIVLTIAE